MADPNGERLYKAEAFLKRPPYLERFDDWLAASMWIDGVVSSAWWRKFSSLRRVHLVPNESRVKDVQRQWITGEVKRDGRQRYGVIRHPRRVWKPRRDALGHELIHVALGHSEETPEEESHLADFCQLDLRFVRRFFGEDAEQLLRERMTRYGVELE